ERVHGRVVEDRKVVDVEADAVADVMPPVVRDARLPGRGHGRPEDLVGRHAGPNLFDRAFLALENRVVVVALLGRYLAEDRGARDVRVVAVGSASDVEPDDVPLAQCPYPWHRIRERRAVAERDDGEDGVAAQPDRLAGEGH